tara:strand:- start:76 stop:342 length:267 start_codon:yes stop_codon:yes gene_type:complete
MNWLVVVLFATMAGDVYIFTNPKFETRQECMRTLQTPDTIAAYTQKLAKEYGRAMPIKLINCLQEDEIKRILNEEHLLEQKKKKGESV